MRVRRIKPWLRGAWYALACLLVAWALLSLTLRLTLPHLLAEPGRFEEQLGRLVGARISVQRLTIRWHHGLPVLGAEEIRVHHPASGPHEMLRVARAEAGLDLLATLTQRRLQLGKLRLSGLELDLVRLADGRFVVAGFPTGDPRFLRWLLRQRGMEIEASRITLRDALAHFEPLAARAVHLRLIGQRTSLRLEVHAASVDGLASDMRLQAILPEGDFAHPAASLSVRATGIGTRAWLSALHREPELLPAAHGAVWLAVQRAGDHSFQLRFALEDFRRDPVEGVASPPLALRGLAQLAPGGLEAQVLEISGAGSTTLPLDWRLRWNRAPQAPPQLSASLDSVPGELLTELAAWLDLDRSWPLPDGGTFENLRLGWRPGPARGEFYLAGEAEDITARATAAWPGVQQLRGEFRLNAAGGAWLFDGADFSLLHPQRLPGPLVLGGLEGHLLWHHVPGQPAHLTARLNGSANEFPMGIRGEAWLAAGARPRVDLEASLGTGDLARLSSLLPRAALRPGAERWAQAAFPAGTLREAYVRLHGDLAQFPFDGGEGRFEASLAIEDADLRYANAWPVASAVAGRARIDGRLLSGALVAGRFGESTLRAADFSLQDILSPQPVLQIRGTLEATLPDIVATLGASPLRERTLPQLAGLSLSQSTELSLDLSIGLKKGMRHDVRGALGFQGNALEATRFGLSLRDLRGKLLFEGPRWRSEALHARLAELPVTLEVDGDTSRPGGVQFALAGTAGTAEILARLARHAPVLHRLLAAPAAPPAQPALQGELRWRARVEGEGEDRRLSLESSLEGLALALPAPLGKPARVPLALTLDLPLNRSGARQTRVKLGELLQAVIQQDTGPHGSPPTTHLDLALGATSPAVPRPEGLYVHGEVAVLPLGEWSALLKRLPPSRTDLPAAIDLRVGSLLTLGQSFAGIQLRGKREPEAWRVAVESERLAGEITLPHVASDGPLTLNLARLWLQSPSEDRRGNAQLVPQQIPGLAMACTSFRYKSLDLGQASLATTPTAEGLHLDALVFQNATNQIRAQGDWTLRRSTHRSQFSILVKAEELGSLLKDFGYEGRGIKGGRTHLEIEAGWAGTPGDFTLEGLTGSLNLSVRRGRILDIEPGSGRLFGLLSLQTLPRRLSLDFADLFSKGYAFDRIEGWFRLENGNAYTNTLFMEGPSSRVEVTGRTGLAARDYDQRAIVTPALSKSIPLASAVFGPAGVGAGAALFLGQKLFKGVPERVDKFLQRQYSITGSWDRPLIEKF